MKNIKFMIIVLAIVFLVSGSCTIYSVNQYNDYTRIAESATKQSANVLSDYGWGVFIAVILKKAEILH